MILSQALNNAALKNPSAAAVLDLGKSISYGEFRKRVGQISYLFQAEVGHGQRIAFLSQNNPSFIISFFAFSNTGNLCFLIDPAETNNEAIVKWLKDLEITHIAVSNDQISRVNDLIRTFGLNVGVIEIEKKKGGEYDPSYSPPPDHPLKDSDPVIIFRHEEFGEEPKYIQFTHKQLYLAATAIRRFYHLLGNDKIMTTLSWAHPYSLVHGMLLPLLNGACCAVDPQSPTHEEFIEYIAQNHITRYVDTPKFYYQLLMICRNAKYTLPGVKSVSVGMGAMSPGLRKTFGLLKIPVLQVYGRVECVWTYAMEDSEKSLGTERPKALALPAVKYKVLNEEGDEIAGPGRREGPFCLTAEFVMHAFQHPDKKVAEKATKQTIRGTWFYTGMIARLEGEDEELTIEPIGRQSDVVKSGKSYVSPERIDAVAAEVPDVADAAGFVRLDNKGEASLACAVVRQGKHLSEAQVLDHCRSRLPTQEQPVSVHFVESIPKDAFDNVNRTALQRQLSGN